MPIELLREISSSMEPGSPNRMPAAPRNSQHVSAKRISVIAPRLVMKTPSARSLNSVSICVPHDVHCSLGRMHAEALLCCWLLLSFCFTSSSCLLATSLAATVDARQIEENAENTNFCACPAQKLMGFSGPSQDLLCTGYQTSFFCPEPQNTLEDQCLSSSEIPPPIFETKKLREIAVDYNPEVCHHSPEEDEVSITFDDRGGARWRTLIKFKYGIFISARIKCPDGNASGLNCSFYLSSLEGERTQDEIDFEFLGRDKGIVQTNYYVEGIGNREQIHLLGFDCSEDFHEYTIKWIPGRIDWLIDGKILRTEEVKEGETFPSKRMYLYASVWNASYIDNGKWAGPYFGHDSPYVCRYQGIHIPVVSEEEALPSFNL